jgi:adenine deaminase
LRDLAAVEIEKVMTDGRVIAAGKELLADLPAVAYPAGALRSVHLRESFSLTIKTPG